MGSPEKISERDSFTLVRRNDHGILSKLRQPAERGGTVLYELRRAHCRSSAQSRAADAARGFGSAAPAICGANAAAPVAATVRRGFGA